MLQVEGTTQRVPGSKRCSTISTCVFCSLPSLKELLPFSAICSSAHIGIFQGPVAHWLPESGSYSRPQASKEPWPVCLLGPSKHSSPTGRALPFLQTAAGTHAAGEGPTEPSPPTSGALILVSPLYRQGGRGSGSCSWDLDLTPRQETVSSVLSVNHCSLVTMPVGFLSELVFLHFLSKGKSRRQFGRDGGATQGTCYPARWVISPEGGVQHIGYKDARIPGQQHLALPLPNQCQAEGRQLTVPRRLSFHHTLGLCSWRAPTMSLCLTLATTLCCLPEPAF